MSDNNNSTPTVEEVRTARRAGFSDSVAFMGEERRTRLTDAYASQDSRREKNVGEFTAQILGGGGE